MTRRKKPRPPFRPPLGADVRRSGLTRNERHEPRDRLSRRANHQSLFRGYITRFTELPRDMERAYRRKYTINQLRMAANDWIETGDPVRKVEQRHKLGLDALCNAIRHGKLPTRPGSPLRFDRVLAMVRRAKQMWEADKRRPPLVYLKLAVEEAGARFWSFKIYMNYEAVPAIHGFRIYYDAETQRRCEELGLGLREWGHNLFDHRVKPDGAPAARPNRPVPRPDAQRIEDARAKFEAVRRRMGLARHPNAATT